MPNVNDLRNSQFLTKEDVTPDKLVTIKGYKEMDVSMDNKPTEMKYVLQLEEFEKPLVLNKTNGLLIASITGSEEFDDWIGRKVVLYNEPSISYNNKLTGGIRVRAIKTAGPTNVPSAESVGRPVDYVGNEPPPTTEDDIPF